MKQETEKIMEGLYVRKNLFGEWGIIRPIKKNPSEPFGKGNINWKNFIIGSWSRLITIVFIIIMLVFLMISYKHDMGVCTGLINSPCVQQCQRLDIGDSSNLSGFNWSKINISNIELGVINNERSSNG
jgi:hypothetical protein